jgi:hypothetical protein
MLSRRHLMGKSWVSTFQRQHGLAGQKIALAHQRELYRTGTQPSRLRSKASHLDSCPNPGKIQHGVICKCRSAGWW